MNPTHRAFLLSLLVAATLAAQGRRGGPPAPPNRSLPDAAGRDVVQRVCGSTCHGPQILTGKGYSRDNWAAVVNGMISRGAKASGQEFGEIVDYLAKNLPPRSGSAGAGGVGFIGAGPDDAHIVDPVAAERGKSVYVAECVTCHGNKARGGPDSLPPPAARRRPGPLPGGPQGPLRRHHRRLPPQGPPDPERQAQRVDARRPGDRSGALPAPQGR